MIHKLDIVSILCRMINIKIKEVRKEIIMMLHSFTFDLTIFAVHSKHLWLLPEIQFYAYAFLNLLLAEMIQVKDMLYKYSWISLLLK